jgi:Tfp pilus assembly protein FimT
MFAEPNYSLLRQKHSIITTVKIIQQYIQYARTLAITNCTKITINPLNNLWSNGIVIKDNKQILKTHIFNNSDLKVSWHGFGTQQNQICIYPDGMTYNNGHFIVKQQRINTPIIIYTLFISKTLNMRVENNIVSSSKLRVNDWETFPPFALPSKI